jgi:hypothetical protein
MTETGSCIVEKGQNRLTFFTLCNYGTASGAFAAFQRSGYLTSDAYLSAFMLLIMKGTFYCKIWENTANVYQDSC